MMLTIDLDFQKFEFVKGATIDVKPLSFGAYQNVFSFLNDSGLTDADGQSRAVLEQMSSPKLKKIFKDVFPTHCKDIEGVLLKREGKEIPMVLDDLMNEGSFVTWGITILAHLFTISSLAKEEKSKAKK